MLAECTVASRLLHQNWVPRDSCQARRTLVAARSSVSEAAVKATDDAVEEGEEGEEEEEEEELEELSVAQHIIIESDFSPVTQQLRDVFDDRFKDPRAIHPDRFLWDYWHIPNQYTLMRTQVSGTAASHAPKQQSSSEAGQAPTTPRHSQIAIATWRSHTTRPAGGRHTASTSARGP
jgi:hypothetical protein